jgi:hypothetical protein
VGSLGALRGSSTGLAASAQADSLWAAVGLRAGAEIPVGGPFLARILGELQAPLTRTSLLVDQEAVWTTPALAAALGLGVVGEL